MPLFFLNPPQSYFLHVRLAIISAGGSLPWCALGVCLITAQGFPLLSFAPVSRTVLFSLGSHSQFDKVTLTGSFLEKDVGYLHF